MDVLAGISSGFLIALTLKNIVYCFTGALIGTLIGVLPGIGPLATIAMLMPFTYHVDPVSSMIMLAGIFYGAQYGGSTTSILLNLPGEASSVITCLDGHQLAKKGKAGVALSVAAVGSLVAGTIGTLAIVLLAPMLVNFAEKFGPAEYCALMTLGLVVAVVLANGSIIKAIAMVFLGVLFGLAGTDSATNAQRYTFGIFEMSDGIDFVPIAMGLFGIAEIISNLEQRTHAHGVTPISSLWPSREEIRRSIGPVLRGTAIGSFLGVLPGGGPTLAAFSSYAVEKRISKWPDQFGKGAIEGVAGPESANNAAAQTAFVPMLALGVPSNAIMALMIGAMMLQGIQPGPDVMTKRPDLFWGIIASMWVGNLMLVVINLPLVGIWVKLLSVPYRFLFPTILAFCCIGAFSLQSSTFHLLMLAGFGFLGYVFIKLGCEPAPFLLGLVLGPQLEEYFRRAMHISRGDPAIFVDRPISLALFALTAVLLILAALPSISRARNETFQEAA
ncbi:MAG: tripartite tricarboxylate transporter permease [Rhizobiales bacterium]|nr:tripartite tricarboxylate transporter permease [Hyphomicrobiales bacterium]